MDTIEIRRALLTDIIELQNIGRQTFFETFTGRTAEEDMQKYLIRSFNFDKLTMEINNPDSEFYLATIGNKTVGYLKINFDNAQTEIQDKDAMEIERIYVLKEFHGKKVGQLLFDKTIQIAKQTSVHYVWLGVWEENRRAINFYKKNGFIEFDKHIFKLGDDEQTDMMMKMTLIPV